MMRADPWRAGRARRCLLQHKNKDEDAENEEDDDEEEEGLHREVEWKADAIF